MSVHITILPAGMRSTWPRLLSHGDSLLKVCVCSGKSQ